MKTMTCKQMGGPCDTQIHGNTADEMMESGGKHVNEMAAKGDEAHKQVKTQMDSMPPETEAGKEWIEKFRADYAALPDDAPTA